MSLALTDETKERISKLVEMGRVTLHFGWIPFIVYVGWTNSSPRPSLIQLDKYYTLLQEFFKVMDVVAGLCAGAASTMVTHPLDLLKTRRQLGKTTTNLKLYRGLAPNLVGNVLAWGSYYGLYNSFQKQLTSLDGPLLYWASSLAAGVTTSFVTTPLWVAKTRTLGSRGEKYRKMSDTIKSIASKDGIRGLWRGFPISLVGNLQASIYFMIYDSLKPRVLSDWDPTLKYLVTSALSKGIAASLMYPHQVVRSRMQFTNCTFIAAIKNIYHTQGAAGFYRGLGFALMRVIPAMCITQVTYENIYSASASASAGE